MDDLVTAILAFASDLAEVLLVFPAEHTFSSDTLLEFVDCERRLPRTEHSALRLDWSLVDAFVDDGTTMVLDLNCRT